MNVKSKIFFSLLLISISTVSYAAEKGQGGIVIKNKAAIYTGSTSNHIAVTLNRGDFVSGVTTMMLMPKDSTFEQSDGRVQVMYYIPDSDGNGRQKFGWMDPSDLSKFYFDCGCSGDAREDEVCSPFTIVGFSGVKWNSCFEEARDDKVDKLNLKK